MSVLVDDFFAARIEHGLGHVLRGEIGGDHQRVLGHERDDVGERHLRLRR